MPGSFHALVSYSKHTPAVGRGGLARANLPAFFSAICRLLVTCVLAALAMTGATAPAPAAPPTFDMFFDAATMPLGGTTQLIFNFENTTGGTLTNVRFNDPLPSGIIVATPNGVFNNCGSGTITAVEGSSSIALSGMTLANGVSCTLKVTIQAITAGGKTNTVTAQSDQGDAAPDSDPVTVTKGGSTTTVSSSANPSAPGQSVTFTATVSSNVGSTISTVPTGTVTFKDGATTIGTGTLNGGQATFTTTALAEGNHTITAAYAGDSNFNASTSSTLTQAVDRSLLGSITIEILASEGDGTFQLSSSTPALSQTLTTAGGRARSSPAALIAGRYTTTLVLPSGFGLVSGSCTDSDSGVDVTSRTATINLAASETVTCTFTTTNSRTKTVATLRRFLGLRNDMLLSNGPGTNRQIDRLEAAQAANGGHSTGFMDDTGSLPGSALPSRLGASFVDRGPAGSKGGMARRAIGQGLEDDGSDRAVQGAGMAPFDLRGQEEGPTRLTFATSLAQMRAAADKAAANQAALQPGHVAAPSARTAPGAWDFWIEGRYVSIGDDRAGASLDGSFGVLYIGSDYIVSPSLLVGALVQFDRLRHTSHVLSSDVDGRGWMVGPYATARLSQHLFLQARAAWGRSDNSVSPFMTYEDHFTSTRWLASSTLEGRWRMGPWQFRPSASLAYIEDASDSYVDTLGVTIPEVKSTLGQASFGPEIAYRHIARDGSILEPRLSLQGIWSFAGNGVDAVAGIPAGPDEMRGRVELGIRAIAASGLTVDLSGSYDGIGAGSWHAVSGMASISVPLN